jgi:ribosomal protein L29
MGTVRTEPGNGERIAQLEMDVDELRRELETLRQQFAAFQKQFQ